MGEVKAMAQKNEAPKKDEGNATGATATITTPYQEKNEVGSADYEDFFNNYKGDEDNNDATFSQNMAQIKVIRTITADMLETRMHYWSPEDQVAMISDKKCIVCGKRNMDWPRYSNHLQDEHSLYMDEDQPEFLLRLDRRFRAEDM